MKNFLRLRPFRVIHKTAALSLALLLAITFAGCTSTRGGVAHNYDTPFGSGTVFVEGSSHNHHAHRVPPGHHKPKKPKKPKKHKVKKPKPPKHHKHHHH